MANASIPNQSSSSGAWTRVKHPKHPKHLREFTRQELFEGLACRPPQIGLMRSEYFSESFQQSSRETTSDVGFVLRRMERER
jgi:hypothetical protein